MDELCPDDIQDAHHVLALLGFPFEVVPVFTVLHMCGRTYCGKMQQCLHGLVSPLGYLGLGTD